MSLVNPRQMLQKANSEGYAVGAFNVNNLETIQAAVKAAQLENAPLILQVSKSGRDYAEMIYLTKLVEAAVISTGLDICLHLDHGETYDICKECVDSGFSSVMIDGSKLPFEENIALTREVVNYAHDKGVFVEAELGVLAGIEDNVNVSENEAKFTDPDQAIEFVDKTGCDSLAIAIGTSHGAYKFKGEPMLRYDILEQIHRSRPDLFLVLHGASSVLLPYVELCNKYGGKIIGAQGVREEMIREATRKGIVKVNIDTDIRLVFTASIRKHLYENPGNYDYREYFKPARANATEIIRHKLRNVLGCSNKA